MKKGSSTAGSGRTRQGNVYDGLGEDGGGFGEYELTAALDRYDDSETFEESRRRYRGRRRRGE